MYCGNNRRAPELLSGNKTIGNRYDCMRKGIGLGLEQPVDESYLDYDPIDNRKIYCGKKRTKPQGYHHLGTNPECLRKGIGIGKKKNAEETFGFRFPIPSFFKPVFSGIENIVILIVLILLIVSLYIIIFNLKIKYLKLLLILWIVISLISLIILYNFSL